MRIYREKDYDTMSRRAASIIAAHVLLQPDCVLGLATGSTPIGTYKKLVEWVKLGALSFKDVKSVNLDEYVGLGPDHPQSYRYFMQENLFDHIDIDPKNTNVPDGLAKDPAAEGARYEQVIASLGGIKLQLLGIGHTGHIGFNEPQPTFEGPTHLVKLAERTIEANARFFESADEVPKEALTMGIGTIMNAKSILLVASGKDKAEIMQKVIEGPITPDVPASVLQLHPDVTIVADEAALSLLKN